MCVCLLGICHIQTYIARYDMAMESVYVHQKVHYDVYANVIPAAVYLRGMPTRTFIVSALVFASNENQIFQINQFRCHCTLMVYLMTLTQ